MKLAIYQNFDKSDEPKENYEKKTKRRTKRTTSESNALNESLPQNK